MLKEAPSETWNYNSPIAIFEIFFFLISGYHIQIINIIKNMYISLGVFDFIYLTMKFFVTVVFEWCYRSKLCKLAHCHLHSGFCPIDELGIHAGLCNAKEAQSETHHADKLNEVEGSSKLRRGGCQFFCM